MAEFETTPASTCLTQALIITLFGVSLQGLHGYRYSAVVMSEVYLTNVLA